MTSKTNFLLSRYRQVQAKNVFIALLPLLILFLNACSPHPAAHTWITHDKNDLGINKITVTFEGTADFYSAADDQSIRRCFWGAKTRNTIELNCVHSDNIDIKEIYELEVTEDGKARLTRDKTIITQFSRQPIRDEELKKIEEEKEKKNKGH
jgi:outer membrane biogenesis lipoprotein LolB